MNESFNTCKVLRKDGATTHMFTLANGMAKRGHDIHLMSGGPPDDERSIKLFNEFLDGNVKHHKIAFPNYAKFDFISKVKQLLTYIFLIPKGIYMIRKINPDIIHVHYPVTSYMAWIYCKLFNKKFITTYHIKGIPNQILHKKANRSIAISSEMIEELEVRWNYSREDISLVFNGVSKDKFDKNISSEEKVKFKEKLNLPTDKKIIGFVGSYEYKKGIDILLEACSKINRDDFHIVLLGDGDTEWVNGLINKLNMNKKVSTFRFQDPVDFYSAFDIFILASRNEGFPLVALEAMMMGVLTIRSNVSGAYDMIEHKTTGLIFENENTEQLSKQVEYLLENEEERINISNEGKVNALNRFTEDIMIDKTIEAYKFLI